MDSHKHGNKEKLSIDSFSLFTCKLIIRKKIVNNQNLNKKCLIQSLHWQIDNSNILDYVLNLLIGLNIVNKGPLISMRMVDSSKVRQEIRYWLQIIN